MATILDIAKALNISKSTVSRALQGHKDIKEETRTAVLGMARQLEYQPNLLAKSLVKNKSNTIGIIVPEFVNSFFPAVIIGAQEVAAASGYNVIICQSQESAHTEIANAQVLLASRVDGVIISMTRETRTFDHFMTFERHGIPVVFFNRACEKMDASRVLVDDYAGAYQAVEHLILSGYRRIAHISGPSSLRLSQRRLKGYRDALKKYKLPPDERLIVRCKAFEEDALPLIRKLARLDPLPDAIFAINDRSAVMALKYFRERNISVPGDIRIAGFNDDPISEVAQPSLTTVMQPGYEVGKLAMGILIDEIDNRSRGNQTYRLKTRLMIRNSSR